MVNENIRFNIDGYYLLDGTKLLHRGTVTLLPDRKLLGVIDSYNDMGTSDTRLFLGVYGPPHIQFIKFPLIGSGIFPVIYSLTSETLRHENIPQGVYRGFWLNLAEISLPEVIYHAVSGGRIRIARELERMHVDELRGYYFHDELVDEYEDCAECLDQRGFLGFQRCS